MKTSPCQPLKIAILVLLCAATMWFFNGYPRYQRVGDELLRNGELTEDLDDWDVSKSNVELSGGGVKLWSPGDGFVQISQTVADNVAGVLLQLGCDIRSREVSNGPLAWHTARVLLLSYDDNGKPLYNRPHLLAKREGSHDWERAAKTFAIASDVAKVEVSAQMSNSSGELWIKSCSLRPVMLKTTFKQYRSLLMWLWGITLAWMALPLLRASLQRWPHALLLLLLGVIFLGVLAPEPLKQAFGEMVWPGTEHDAEANVGVAFDDAQVFGLALRLPNPDIFKLGHFVMFGLLAMMLASGRAYRLTTASLMFHVLLLALVSEVLQLFMPGRGPQLGDIAIDAAGALTGLLLWHLGHFGFAGKS